MSNLYFKRIAKSSSEIALVIGVHKSSVCRELRRNSKLTTYNHIQAQEKGLERKEKITFLKHVFNNSMIKIIESNLRLYQWSL